MKILLILFLLLPLSTTVQAKTKTLYNWDVIAVIDGDTVAIRIPGLPEELNNVKVRLLGIDTPEKDGVCELERIRAKQATEFLRNYLYGVKKAFFYNIKWDKYGGRINANMIVNGVDINQLLVSQGHAIYYDGKAKKHDWCRE